MSKLRSYLPFSFMCSENTAPANAATELTTRSAVTVCDFSQTSGKRSHPVAFSHVPFSPATWSTASYGWPTAISHMASRPPVYRRDTPTTSDCKHQSEPTEHTPNTKGDNLAGGQSGLRCGLRCEVQWVVGIEVGRAWMSHAWPLGGVIAVGNSWARRSANMWSRSRAQVVRCAE